MCKKQHNVHLVFLPPNTTHLTQPLDVAFFRLLKIAWREILLYWKKKEGHNEKSLPESVFPRLLNILLTKIGPNAETNLKSGFRKSGINPLNRQEVSSRLPDYNTQTHGDASIVSDSVIDLLKSMRYYSEEEKPAKKKKRLDVAPGKSVDDGIIDVEKNKQEEEKSKKNKKNKNMKGLCKTKKTKVKENTMKKENDVKKSDELELKLELKNKESCITSNKMVVDIEPKAGPSNLLMCRVCHCVKNKGDSWIKCNICHEQICCGCSGDALPIEFICLRCLQADSDDSAVEDEDYNPVKSGYTAYDEESTSSD